VKYWEGYLQLVKWSFGNYNKIILSQIPWEYYFYVTLLSRMAGIYLKKGSEWKISVANICPKSGVKVSAERDVKYELVNLIRSTESGLTCRRYYGRTCGWTTSRSCGLAWCQGCPVFTEWHIRSGVSCVRGMTYQVKTVRICEEYIASLSRTKTFGGGGEGVDSHPTTQKILRLCIE